MKFAGIQGEKWPLFYFQLLKIGKFGNWKSQHFRCKENEIEIVGFCNVTNIGM